MILKLPNSTLEQVYSWNFIKICKVATTRSMTDTDLFLKNANNRTKIEQFLLLSN